jgi:nucleolar protein 12
LLEKKPRDAPKPANLAEAEGDEEPEGDDEELSEISEELDYDDSKDDDEESSSNEDSDDEDHVEKEEDVSMAEAEDQDAQVVEPDNQPRRERKRKRKEDNEDLEAKYMASLTQEDNKEGGEEPSGKRQKAEEKDDVDQDDAVPIHESLAQESKVSDVEKAARTVFLANVSSEAISSKTAKKTLITHLSSALDPNDTPAQKFESIRFRSVAFSTGSMPKRAAYITKALMDSTTKSANAYAVFSTPAAARQVASKLNGTEVLDRHIRVDSVAHPSPTDHRRCVFVGNLGFVDDETIINTNEDGEKVEKKRTKVPSDIEEGLWRSFGKIGKVENVRVVRDPKTRVGKGFAYVQFYVSLLKHHVLLRHRVHLTLFPGRQ